MINEILSPQENKCIFSLDLNKDNSANILDVLVLITYVLGVGDIPLDNCSCSG